MAIKAAMLYNLPLLYGLYALVASLQLVTGGRAVFNLLCAIGSGCLFSDVSIGVVVILSLVANSIHQLLIHGFTWLSRFIAASQQSQRGGRIIMRPSTMLLVLCPFAALMFLQQLWSLKGLFSCTMFVAGLEAVYLACFALIGSSHHDATMIEEQMSYSDNKVAFAALIVLTIPGIMAGAIDLMIWEQIVEGRSWWLWSWIVLPVLMVCRLKILAKSSLSSRVGWSPAVLRLLVIMWNCPLMLARGNAYRVSHLVIGLVVTELVLEIAIRFLRR